MPPGNSGQDLAVLQGALFQPGIHKPFVTQGQRFVPGGRVSAKIHKAFTQAAVQLFQQFGTGRAGQIHLIDKYKGRDAVPAQQLPQGLGVALHAARPLITSTA